MNQPQNNRRSRRDRRDRLKEFFEDSYGIYSMVRLGYFLSLVLSGFVVIACTLKGEPEKATELVLAINGIGTAGKVIQKQVEKTPPPKDSDLMLPGAE